MRDVLAVAGLLLLGLAADPATALVARAPAQQSEVVLAGHRLWHRVPTSPYYSAGYPRLYYYPWGLRPHARWRRWQHR